MQDEEAVHNLEVYTDGAASLNDVWPRTVRSAGWCAVFLSHTAHGVASVGVMYGPVVSDPGSHAYVGVLRLSSNAAELNALMLAVRGVSVALQLEELAVPWLDTSFVSDNKYALGIVQFEARAVANHAQAQISRQWSWAAKNQFAAKFLHVRAHTGVAGNEFADVGAEFGRRMQCTSLFWLRTSVSAREEAVAISSVERKLELCVGSANVRTLSPATDEPEVHSVRRRVLADAFSRKTHRSRGSARDACAQFDISCVCGVFHMVTSAAVFGQGKGRDLDWTVLVRLQGARHGHDFVDSCFNLRFPFHGLFGPCVL